MQKILLDGKIHISSMYSDCILAWEEETGEQVWACDLVCPVDPPLRGFFSVSVGVKVFYSQNNQVSLSQFPSQYLH